MTRETKIGLLVGLAFIIVIGILLSDHLTQSTEPPQATLAVAGNSVRSTVNTPGSSTANPPITSVIQTPPQQVAPAQPIPTVTEVSPHQSPVQVEVGGTRGAPSAGQPGLARNTPEQQPAQTSPDSTGTTGSSQPEQTAANDPSTGAAPPPLEVANSSNDNATNAANNTAASRTQQQGVNSALRDLARQNHEELVAVGGSGNTISSPPPPSSTRTNSPQTTTPTRTAVASSNSPTGAAPAPAGMTKYTAVENDTVSKMASRFLGANTKENRALILAANPSLQANPDKIIVGRSYNIPKPGTTIAQATPAPAANSSSPSASRSNSSSTNNTGEIWYTIKEGDTLSRIAQEQCGTIGAVQAIIELNPETLSDANNIVVNTKIRLPSKQVAAAN